VEADGRVLLVKRIHVEYHLKRDPEKWEEAERAHAVHVENCPVARSIRDCVDITTSLIQEDL
jgi:organic hydroperoxide reductase OsmC/OhrA